MSITRQQVDEAVAEGRLTEDMWDIKQAAKFLGIPVGTLYNWRSKGVGPRSCKMVGSVVYDPYDLRKYALDHMQESAA